MRQAFAEEHTLEERPTDVASLLLALYRELLGHYGPQHWWPTITGSRWEIMLGAVLTQHTNWQNVVSSLRNLLDAGGPDALSEPGAVLEMPLDVLAELVRPAGHYTQKPLRLRNLAQFVLDAGGVDALANSQEGTQALRQRLLAVRGVGPETADGILLYALDRPVFVADAYALRLASRWGLLPPNARYDAIQRLFMDNLPHDVGLFNEYHALIVAHGKVLCRTRPLCDRCFLGVPFRVDEAEKGTVSWACPRLPAVPLS